jgi:hypothetical protein
MILTNHRLQQRSEVALSDALTLDKNWDKADRSGGKRGRSHCLSFEDVFCVHCVQWV